MNFGKPRWHYLSDTQAQVRWEGDLADQMVYDARAGRSVTGWYCVRINLAPAYYIFIISNHFCWKI